MKKKNETLGLNRREFLRLSALGLASLTIMPSWSMNGRRIAPTDRVVLGFIGLGQQGVSDFRSFSSCPGVQVAACCDVDSIKRERFKNIIEKWQASNNSPQRCDKYEFYEDMLERRDIDAVSIATPDHWHALNVIDSARAQKDIYCQKPLGYTITEGWAMTKAVNDNNRVLQVGSQQRSSNEFIKAIALVQAGAIGHIEKIYAKVGDPPRPFDLPEMPVPANLNFNEWLGPLNNPNVHYHSDICPVISIEPKQNEQLWGAWRWYQETGNGFTADWGAHMFDIAQAAIGMDGSAPVEYIPKGYQGAKYLTMKYANGIIMTEQPYRDDDLNAQGIKFIGTKGWIQVARGFLQASDPKILQDTEKKTSGVKAGEFEVSSPHMQNFIDCVRSRKKPVASVEVGCSTNTLCCLANIATELKRPVKWNPATLSFVDDDKEAQNHRLYGYKYRDRYANCYIGK